MDDLNWFVLLDQFYANVIATSIFGSFSFFEPCVYFAFFKAKPITSLPPSSCFTIVPPICFIYINNSLAFNQRGLKFTTSLNQLAFPATILHHHHTCWIPVERSIFNLKLGNRHLYFMKFQFSITWLYLLCSIKLLKSLKFIWIPKELLVVRKLIDKAEATFWLVSCGKLFETFRGFHISATLFTVHLI